MAIEVFHTITYANGAIYPCFCPKAEDHDAEYLTLAEVVQSQLDRERESSAS